MTDPIAKFPLLGEGVGPSAGLPLVSVYLPTRNRPALLERAIRSVFAQTYSNIQLVVIDDGSARETGETIDRLVKENTSPVSMTVLRLTQPQGACRARNLGLEVCEGVLVTGLDDDDFFVPERISRLVQGFDSSTCAFVFDGYVRETILRDGSVHRSAVRLNKPADLDRLLKRNIVGNQILTLTQRLRDAGGFDPALPAWQDYDLWIRLVRMYGSGKPIGGFTYHQVLDDRIPRISTNHERLRDAWELFRHKHPEYRKPVYRSFLNLSKACYGSERLSSNDLINIARSGEPYLLLSATYFFVRNWTWGRLTD